MMGAMKIIILVLSILLVCKFSQARLQLAEVECGVNRHFSDCGAKCPRTCSNRNPICTKECVPGCVCDEGYIENDRGQCILENLCPPRCQENEEYNQCGSACPEYCNQPDLIACTRQCVPGCFCKEGYVLDKKDGRKCIPKEQCKCPANSQYSDCTSACDPTCEHPEPRFCRDVCGKGCKCNEGYVKGPDRTCIKVEDCPKCGDNQVYRGCGSGCGNATCDDGPRTICPAVCVEGCFCKDGYVELNGCCAPNDNCPPKCEGPNEVYETCKSACGDFTCEKQSYEGEPCVFQEKCLIGCFCERGFVRNSENICIPVEECPAQDQCGPNAEFTNCGSGCGNYTCANPTYTGDPCPELCVQGCFCKEGFVAFGDRCVPRNKCAKIGCGENASYKNCGSRCPPTCDNPSPSCAKDCVQGCFCDEGYIRESYNGPCIPQNSCNQPECGRNEHFSQCGSRCPPTCDNRNPICTKECFPSCVCNEGFIRNARGRCIRERRCPPRCRENEEYNQCGSACPEYCNQPDLIACTRQCVPGCFCKKGFVLDVENGEECIPKEECPLVCSEFEREANVSEGCEKSCDTINAAIKCAIGGPSCVCAEGYIRREPGEECIKIEDCRDCGRNAQFICGSNCGDKTCDRPSFAAVTCLAGCTFDCFCDEGFVRDRSNNCIRLEDCPKNPCGKNEKYVENGCETACGSKKPECRLGEFRCVCEDGFRRDSNNNCVLPEDCSQCPRNQEYRDCNTTPKGIPCEATCKDPDLPTRCFAQCAAGCYCKDGFIRDENNNCIDPKDCPSECGRNEHFSQCGSRCPPTCANPNPICTKECVRRCVCNDGFIRNRFGDCIPEKHCPPRCRENEEYKECGSACPEYCNQPDLVPCTKQCVRGCFCKEGFVLDVKNGEECIPKEECPDCHCPPNEHIANINRDCEKTCETRFLEKLCIEGEPICVCNQGFVRHNGRCIPEDKCPDLECSRNEHWTDEGKFCDDTCDSDRLCVYGPGCRCNEGLVRHNGRCIPEEKCPDLECSRNEHWTDEGKFCDDTCGSDRVCVYGPGCRCNKGLVRHNGRCIPKDKCPDLECSRNEHWTVEGKFCDDTCGSDRVCVYGPGCRCNEGLVRHHGRCIENDECPPDVGDPPCPKNEIYMTNGPDCGDPTCSNFHNYNERHINYNTKGCFCIRDYVRNSENECVPKYHCKACVSSSTSESYSETSTKNDKTKKNKKNEKDKKWKKNKKDKKWRKNRSTSSGTTSKST